MRVPLRRLNTLSKCKKNHANNILVSSLLTYQDSIFAHADNYTMAKHLLLQNSINLFVLTTPPYDYLETAHNICFCSCIRVLLRQILDSLLGIFRKPAENPDSLSILRFRRRSEITDIYCNGIRVGYMFNNTLG